MFYNIKKETVGGNLGGNKSGKEHMGERGRHVRVSLVRVWFPDGWNLEYTHTQR